MTATKLSLLPIVTLVICASVLCALALRTPEADHPIGVISLSSAQRLTRDMKLDEVEMVFGVKGQDVQFENDVRLRVWIKDDMAIYVYFDRDGFATGWSGSKEGLEFVFRDLRSTFEQLRQWLSF